MRLLSAIFFGWLFGVGVYVAALGVFWNQAMSSGDAVAVLLWSAIATGVFVPIVYWPALRHLARQLHGHEPFVAFPLVAIALGIAPVLFIVLMFGGGLRDLASPEVCLFYVMFSTIGLVVGSVFAMQRAVEKSST